MHFNRLKFSGVFELFSFTLRGFFLVQKCKTQRFEENNGFGVLFIELNCRWLQTGLADLKTHQTLEILLMTDFLRFF